MVLDPQAITTAVNRVVQAAAFDVKDGVAYQDAKRNKGMALLTRLGIDVLFAGDLRKGDRTWIRAVYSASYRLFSAHGKEPPCTPPT